MTDTATLLPDDVRFIRGVRANVAERMFGIDGVIDSLLVALMTGGHVLLEGNPGLGKTALVKTLAAALDLPGNKVGRIQFTPDLMPSDIIGTLMPTLEDSTRLAFQPGPIFRWLLLADEINRATPKTQAAMLEAMAEKQVTVLGERRSLIDPVSAISDTTKYQVRPPFMVMATQNPIDQEGTYNLPEAQSDRFMFKIRMPFPNPEVLKRIVMKEMELQSLDARPGSDDPGDDVVNTRTLVHLHRLDRAIRHANNDPLVSQHIRNMVTASNISAIDGLSLPARQEKDVKDFVLRFVRYPLGPRAAFAMELGARGLAVLRFIDEEASQEIGDHLPAAFARLCIPAIRHRLKLRLGWEREFFDENVEDDLTFDRKQDALLRRFTILCAPDDNDYQSTISDVLDAFLGDPV